MSGLVDKLKDAVATKPIYLDIIYRINENTAAKVYALEEYAIQEYRIGKKLFNAGVQVPEFFDMEEIDPVRKNPVCPKEWVIFMQYIKGKHIPKIGWFFNRNERREAVRQYKEQIKSVLELGIEPFDAEWHLNSLFNEEERKLYLIDFAMWNENPHYTKICDWYEAINGPSITLAVSVNRTKLFWG
jgi:RIO-like serine/threonine protein kinase